MARSSHAAKPPSQRQLRVGELIRHALSEILVFGEVHDPFIEETTITVSEVAVSPDLKLATCYIRALGETDMGPVVEAMQRHRKFLRGAIARRIDLRFSPELRFRADTSFEVSDRIDALLRSPSVRRDLDRDPDKS